MQSRRVQHFVIHLSCTLLKALVDEAPTLKRFRPRAQGRGFQILKRASTLTLVVSTDRAYRPHGFKKVVNAKANPNKVVFVKSELPALPEKVAKKAAAKKSAATSTSAAPTSTKKAAAKKATAPKEEVVATEGKAE